MIESNGKNHDDDNGDEDNDALTFTRHTLFIRRLKCIEKEENEIGKFLIFYIRKTTWKHQARNKRTMTMLRYDFGGDFFGFSISKGYTNENYYNKLVTGMILCHSISNLY